MMLQGPELLVDLQDYDYSLDMWSLGCMVAGELQHSTHHGAPLPATMVLKHSTNLVNVVALTCSMTLGC